MAKKSRPQPPRKPNRPQKPAAQRPQAERPPPEKPQARRPQAQRPAAQRPQGFRAESMLDEGRRRLLLYGGGGTVVVAVIVVLIVVLATGGGSGGGTANALALTRTLSAAGCTLNTYPELPRNHVGSPDAKVKYNSFPPTSGPHFQQPAAWGNYPTPLSQVQAVHNLEHGGIVIQYGSKVPRAAIDQLNAFYGSDPNGLLMAPLPQLGGKIALTAWTHLAQCTRFDEKAYKAFRDAYRGQGPEPFPVSQLQPGT